MGRPARFKKAIYDSALKLFGQRGLGGTGIREIAKAAGVSEAALYRHWKGKKELARDIFVQGLAELCQKLQAEIPPETPADQAVLRTVRIFYEAYDAHSDIVLYLLLSEHELWRTLQPEDPNPVSFWFDVLRTRAPEFRLPAELSGEILGPITLGMILRPGIATAYGSVEPPLAQYAVPVAVAICRLLGLTPTDATSAPPTAGG